MVMFPRGGLGRLLFAIIIITTISYLVLNIVSFGGTRWITYVDVPVRFGLWRVCDTSIDQCSDWPNAESVSDVVNATFGSSKPGFIRSSQGLEIVSLIFYIIAAAVIIIGIVDMETFPLEMAFMVAAALLFICIVFLSASLGLMSKQGRDNHPLAFLDWAWWNGLVGLLMTIFCFVALICFLAYIAFSSSVSRENSPSIQRGSKVKGVMGRSSPPMVNPIQAPPIITPNLLSTQPYNYPNLYQYSPNNNYSNQSYHDPTMNYVNQPQFPQYNNDQSPSPIVTELARQYVHQISDTRYQNQLLEPYRQYLQDPYLINNYL